MLMRWIAASRFLLSGGRPLTVRGSRRWRRRRRQTDSNSLPRIGLTRERYACPGRRRHDDRARDCERMSPAFCGNGNEREAECGMIAGESGRYGKEQRDHGPDDQGP